MLRNVKVKLMRERIEQGTLIEVEELTAERAVLVQSKRTATAAGNSAEYVRCLARIAAIDTRLQELATAGPV